MLEDIDWDKVLEIAKVLEKPDRTYKVLGKDILAIRSTMRIHEKEIKILTEEKNYLQTELKSVNSKLVDKEWDIEVKTQELDSFKNVFRANLEKVERGSEEEGEKLESGEKKEGLKGTATLQLIELLVEKDRRISHIIQELKTKDEQIIDKDQTIASLNIQIRNLNAIVEDYDEKALSIKRVLSEADQASSQESKTDKELPEEKNETSD